MFGYKCCTMYITSHPPAMTRWSMFFKPEVFLQVRANYVDTKGFRGHCTFTTRVNFGGKCMCSFFPETDLLFISAQTFSWNAGVCWQTNIYWARVSKLTLELGMTAGLSDESHYQWWSSPDYYRKNLGVLSVRFTRSVMHEVDLGVGSNCPIANIQSRVGLADLNSVLSSKVYKSDKFNVWQRENVFFV